MIKTLVAIAFVGLNYYTYHHFATKPVYPERASFSGFPDQLGDWTCSGRQELDDEVKTNLGVTDYLICYFTREDDPIGVDVYVGYHRSQVREGGGGAGENSIHPPAHCLPGSGWDIIDSQTIALPFEGLPQADATANRLIIGACRGRLQLEDQLRQLELIERGVSIGVDEAQAGRGRIVRVR